MLNLVIRLPALVVLSALLPGLFIFYWLPQAMVKPVSVFLHAVAEVKAGAFGFVRVLYGCTGHADLGTGSQAIRCRPLSPTRVARLIAELEYEL